jgi:predicted MFS family arabinose efflux permease
MSTPVLRLPLADPSPGPGAAQRGLAAALWLGLGVAIGHGLGRFGYALLMPAMQAELHWSYEQASWINTANALGYIAGTVSGVLLLRRASSRRLFRAGLWMVVVSLPCMAVPLGFAWLLLLRVLSGVGAAWAFSTGGALVNELYGGDPRRKGSAIGLFFGSAGIGMVLAGAVVPLMVEAGGAAAWPSAWLVLGAASAAMLVFPLRVARGEGGPSLAAVAGARLDVRPAWLALVAYFGFAVSHTGYVLFVFAWTRTQAFAWFHGAGMWMLMGAGVFASAWIWQGALARWRAERTLALCCLACAAAALVPVLHPGLGAVYGSAALMGVSLFIAPAAMTALVRQTLPPPTWGKALMLFSVVFALGQALGSWAFGLAADAWSSLAGVLGVASAGLLVSAAAAFCAGRRVGAGP